MSQPNRNDGQRQDLSEARDMRRKTDERREASIRKMRADGLSYREIAQAMNTSRSQVEKVLARTEGT